MSENVYKRGKTWWLRIQIDGREHRSSLRTRDRREAERKAAEEIRRLRSPNVHSEKTWFEAVVDWSSDIASEIREATIKRYQCSIRQLEPHLSQYKIAEITRQRLTNVVRARKAEGATNATIRRDLTALASVIDTALIAGVVHENIARDFVRDASKRTLKERRDPIVLPRSQDIEFVASFAPRAIGEMVRLCARAGLRLEEAASLKRSQIDERSGRLTLTKTKTNRARALDMRALGISAIISRQPRAPRGDYVFWHASGERYSNLSSRFAAICSSAQASAQAPAGFRRFRFHDLRHYAAVNLLRAGVPLYDVQAILGHSSVKTTELYLDHLTTDERKIVESASAQMSSHVQRFRSEANSA